MTLLSEPAVDALARWTERMNAGGPVTPLDKAIGDSLWRWLEPAREVVETSEFLHAAARCLYHAFPICFDCGQPSSVVGLRRAWPDDHLVITSPGGENFRFDLLCTACEEEREDRWIAVIPFSEPRFDLTQLARRVLKKHPTCLICQSERASAVVVQERVSTELRVDLAVLATCPNCRLRARVRLAAA